MKKEQRYALIRQCAIKVQNEQTVIKKYENAIKYMDDKSNLGWGDTEDYLIAHYGDIVEANNE